MVLYFLASPQRREGEILGVKKVIYEVSRKPYEKTHHYVQPLEEAVLEGQGVYRVALELKKSGFYPDVVYAHSGWGVGLFIKDIFPKAKYLCYFEWFYHAHGTDADFDPSDPLDANGEAKIRVKNAPILLDLASCDGGLCPTSWQRQQFPPEFHSKLKVLHDGIDTAFFKPNDLTPTLSYEEREQDPPFLKEKPNTPPFLRGVGGDLIKLGENTEIVTYVSRGFEPYRGFPQFMEAVAYLQKNYPNTHVVVVGDDRVAYGKKLPDGKTYKELMLEKFDFDMSRLHFTGSLPYREYLKVLQASAVHIYLTRPFVLSWSILEAMAVGCVVVGSKTPPVEEVITDGVNGFLVDFFDVKGIATKVSQILDNLESVKEVRKQARKTILERYDLASLLPVHLHWLRS